MSLRPLDRRQRGQAKCLPLEARGAPRPTRSHYPSPRFEGIARPPPAPEPGPTPANPRPRHRDRSRHPDPTPPSLRRTDQRVPTRSLTRSENTWSSLKPSFGTLQGLMTKTGFAIDTVRTHIFDLDENDLPIFSRDCVEYLVRTPAGAEVLVLVNH